KPGDIMSFGPTSLGGHTSIVIESNVDGNGNGTIKTLNQNLTADGYDWLTVKNWYVQTPNYGTPQGWLHDPLSDQTCPAPTLVSPGDNATSNTRIVTFDWNDSTCSNVSGYTLHVTTGSGPEDGIIPNGDMGVGPSQQQFTFLSDGTFYWHVATWSNGQRS